MKDHVKRSFAATAFITLVIFIMIWMDLFWQSTIENVFADHQSLAGTIKRVEGEKKDQGEQSASQYATLQAQYSACQNRTLECPIDHTLLPVSQTFQLGRQLVQAVMVVQPLWGQRMKEHGVPKPPHTTVRFFISSSRTPDPVKTMLDSLIEGACQNITPPSPGIGIMLAEPPPRNVDCGLAGLSKSNDADEQFPDLTTTKEGVIVHWSDKRQEDQQLYEMVIYTLSSVFTVYKDNKGDVPQLLIKQNGGIPEGIVWIQIGSGNIWRKS